tara:strand:- start:1815 stop:2891 length:1077 start_codon:yes stop_codon:yes gene_type:complete
MSLYASEYPSDAPFQPPEIRQEPNYVCETAVRNSARVRFENVSFGECETLGVNHYLSEFRAWNVKEECTPDNGSSLVHIYCSFSSTHAGHNGETGLSVSIAYYMAEGTSTVYECNSQAYSDGVDTTGDGNIDKCYNPNDLLKIPEKAEQFCKSEPNAFTLSSEEEDKIKSAARLAKQSLERMEADLAAPNEINSGKLNQIASLFGIENYQDPQFAILTTAIQSGSIGCVKNKLDAASLDPSGNGYLSFEDANGGVSGVHCKDKNGDDIIQVHVKDISHFHPVYANQAMQELLVHETQHGCNDVHPLNMHYMEKSEIRSKFDTQVQSYKNLVGSGNELDILKRLIKNPYYFEYLLKVYL